MLKHKKQSRTSTRILADTASASMEVIASRLLALSDPNAFGSQAQMRELSGMVSEKLQAGAQGWAGAALQLAMLPYRMAWTFASPSTLTASGAAQAWAEAESLWLGVGNAALAPVRRKVVANRAKLRRRAHS
jgi:hypothetical protein